MEVLKIFAWPIAVFAIAVFALLLFKRQIGAFVERTKRVGKEGWEGLEAGAAITKQQAAVAVPPDPKPILLPNDSFLVRNLESTIREELRSRDLVNAADRETYLVRYAAEAQLAAIFEVMYSLIYGSQLAVLQLVNTGAQPLTAVVPFYERGKELAPAAYADYSFEQWLHWLQGVARFVSRDGETVSITPEGREFLKFVVSRGYQLFKNN